MYDKYIIYYDVKKKKLVARERVRLSIKYPKLNKRRGK